MPESVKQQKTEIFRTYLLLSGYLWHGIKKTKQYAQIVNLNETLKLTEKTKEIIYSFRDGK